MKILILCESFGINAPGIVYEKIIFGLSKNHQLKLITTSSLDFYKLKKSHEIVEISKPQIPTRIYKFFMSFFSISVFDYLWVKKVGDHLKLNKQYSPDIILSMISNNHFSPIIAGNKFALFYDVKHFTYSVDAIPAPAEWLNNDSLYTGTKKFISKQLSKVDGLFSANASMLDYQLKLFKPKKDFVKEVIYNPTLIHPVSFEKKNQKMNTFLYTGGIYGKRKVTNILMAFRKILDFFPDSTLEFVGSKISSENFLIFSKKDRKKIIVHPYTKDLIPFYERATALIDIDADLEDDIFLSSKIINYLSINRIIISETGKNSPSRMLFKNIYSIFQCSHDSDELAEAMKKAIFERDNIDFKDRESILGIFNIDSIVLKINKAICSRLD